ncbi:MAG TPA: immunoglobulin domain-containing protein, partial [Phycisphaerae bacterium]|nr:immunoglobulin domain-containing protein [Phycisphaerae bacterium]
SVPPGAGSVVPDNASVCVGDNVIWTAVGGFGPGKVQYYRYAWDRNPTHAFTGTEPVWSSGVIATQPTAAGTWYLHIQGFNGADAPNGTCDYAVVAGTSPSIVQQPAPQSVCIGAVAQFTVVADGAGLTYQWQADGSNLSEDAHHSGVTTNTLTITNTDSGDAANYRCVITGTCGSVTSETAALTLEETVAIAEQPVTQDVCPGGTATFRVQVTGDPSPTYRWQKDGADLSDGGHYSGATSPTLTVAGADESDVADYRCIVTGRCGSLASAPATLVLQTATTITRQPEPQSAAAGSAAVFTIVAAGTGSLTYQWQKDGEDIPGAITDTLSLNPVRRADAGNYRCVVSSDCGSVISSEAALTVTVYAADFDEDGDVDLADFTTFQACFNGPNRPPKPGCAGNADFDGDSDVDLTDFATFQACFNGPNRPPKTSCPQ